MCGVRLSDRRRCNQGQHRRQDRRSLLRRVRTEAEGSSRLGNSGREGLTMEATIPVASRHEVQLNSCRISYLEQGSGPVALFVHGVLLNSYLWRHQLENLSDIRRCIAPDLLAHGNTEIASHQDVSVTANAKML